jgi:hypothetical protein
MCDYAFFAVNESHVQSIIGGQRKNRIWECRPILPASTCSAREKATVCRASLSTSSFYCKQHSVSLPFFSNADYSDAHAVL